MARFQRTRNFGRRARSAYRSTRGFRKGRGYAGYSKGNLGFGFGKFGLSLSIPFIAGIAVGMTDLDNQISAPIKLALACAPVRGLGPVKAVAQGMVLGDMIQHYTGFSLPLLGSTGAGTNLPWGVNS